MEGVAAHSWTGCLDLLDSWTGCLDLQIRSGPSRSSWTGCLDLQIRPLAVQLDRLPGQDAWTWTGCGRLGVIVLAM